MSDIDNFHRIVRSLVDKNNTVIIIEHNLDIIRFADWVIDLGPDGGKKGGEVIFEGMPEDLIKCDRSFTGKYLKSFL
jgi:excinuclease ABC subunit A